MKIDALIKIADRLDAAGFVREATFIDSLIEKIAGHSRGVYDFAEDIIAAFKDIASKPDVLPTINEKSLPEIIQVIDSVLNKKQYGSPELSMQTFNEVQSNAYRIGAGILSLEDDIPKIQKAISETTDENEKRMLFIEERKIKDSLQKLRDEVSRLKEGKREEDKQLFEQLKAYMKGRGKEI